MRRDGGSVFPAHANTGDPRAAALFAQAGRCHAKHGHEGENGSASANLDNDIAAQLPERTARRPFAHVHSERRRKPVCPEVCPTTLTDLVQWMQMIGRDADRLNYVFVTVDPERDTPKVMHDYVSAFDPRIRGLTGTSEQIARVTKEYGVYYKRIPTSDGGYVMDHSTVLYMMDPNVRFVGVIPYQEDTAKAVAKLKKLAASPLAEVSR
jgi:hypothetical protein